MQPGAHEAFVREVKVLADSTPEGLTEKVNDFLVRNGHLDIKDVKFSTCTAEGKLTIYSALILL